MPIIAHISTHSDGFQTMATYSEFWTDWIHGTNFASLYRCGL